LRRAEHLAASPGLIAEEAMPLAPYRVAAYNTAHDSENKIHDDATARRFGFGGGLVPGVDVYAYMTHMPVARWGRAWLEGGTAEAAARYLADAHESLPIYAEERLIHPRDILRGGNFVLSRNVALGPWIHVGSRIRHFATAPVGASLAVRAHITANYEHKGHR